MEVAPRLSNKDVGISKGSPKSLRHKNGSSGRGSGSAPVFEKLNESLTTPPSSRPHPIPCQDHITPLKKKSKLSKLRSKKNSKSKKSLGQGGSVCKIWDRSVQPFYRDDER